MSKMVWLHKIHIFGQNCEGQTAQQMQNFKFIEKVFPIISLSILSLLGTIINGFPNILSINFFVIIQSCDKFN